MKIALRILAVIGLGLSARARAENTSRSSRRTARPFRTRKDGVKEVPARRGALKRSSRPAWSECVGLQRRPARPIHRGGRRAIDVRFYVISKSCPSGRACTGTIPFPERSRDGVARPQSYAHPAGRDVRLRVHAQATRVRMYPPTSGREMVQMAMGMMGFRHSPEGAGDTRRVDRRHSVMLHEVHRARHRHTGTRNDDGRRHLRSSPTLRPGPIHGW